MMDSSILTSANTNYISNHRYEPVQIKMSRTERRAKERELKKKLKIKQS